MSKKKLSKQENQQTAKTFETQAISQADSRESKSSVALPSDENVEYARNWVNYNKK